MAVSGNPRTYRGKASNSPLDGKSATFQEAPPFPTSEAGFYSEVKFKDSLRYFALINLGPGSLYFRFNEDDEWAWLPPYAGFENDNVRPISNSIFIGGIPTEDAYWQILTIEERS